MHDILREREGLRDREGAIPMLGEELLRLALPPLAGCAFLEIGCHEGYFCGFAWFEGARKVIGLDAEAQGLERARERFPHCTFSGISRDLAKLLVQEGGFDVILCSFLPGFVDMASFLPLLMAGLKRNGTLILKLPMTEQKGLDAMKLGEAAFSPPWPVPAEPRVAQALEAWTCRDMGESVFPTENGAKKHILHVRHKAPYALLLTGDAASGKASLAKRLFSGLAVIHGDALLTRIAMLPPGNLKESHPALNALCTGAPSPVSVGALMIPLFTSAAGAEYARLVSELAGGRDFVYEGVMQENFREVFAKYLEMLGYMVVTLSTPAPDNAPGELFRQAREEERKYRLYLDSRRHAG